VWVFAFRVFEVMVGEFTTVRVFAFSLTWAGFRRIISSWHSQSCVYLSLGDWLFILWVIIYQKFGYSILSWYQAFTATLLFDPSMSAIQIPSKFLFYRWRSSFGCVCMPWQVIKRIIQVVGYTLSLSIIWLLMHKLYSSEPIFLAIILTESRNPLLVYLHVKQLLTL